jgi:XTP/dITP diphosphohydrolase
MVPMKIYLASGNAHKAEEFRSMAGVGAGKSIDIVSAAEIGGMPFVEEDTGSFSGNSQKKMKALAALLPEGAWALADDSGLCVEALDGAPGVESAYYAGPEGDPVKNLEKLVVAMDEFQDGEREAEFVCVLSICGPGGVELQFEGRCPGSLLRRPRGSGGFGYDPLFVPEGFDLTMAEMPRALKNTVGHRGRAWAACAAWLAAQG